MTSLAKKIMHKCHVIPPHRFNVLLSVLIQLNKNGSLSTRAFYEYPLSMHNLLSWFNQKEPNDFSLYVDMNVNNVHLDRLDNYIEMLYDELEDKIKAAQSILNLVSKPENLRIMFKNDTLLCALSRVLREDGKKFPDLAILIVNIFCHFSTYSDFQFAISNVSIFKFCNCN